MNKGAKCRERVQETQTIRSILPSPHETSLISLSLAARTRIAVSTFPKPWNLLLSFTAFNSNLRRTEQTEKYMGEQRAGEMEVDIEISSAAEVKRRCTSPKVILGRKFPTKVRPRQQSRFVCILSATIFAVQKTAVIRTSLMIVTRTDYSLRNTSYS